MTTATKYDKVIAQLKDEIIAQVGDCVHSIVLFGSVARGEATPDSDIDLLLITDGSQAVKDRIHEMSYDIDLEYEVFTQLVFFTKAGFEKEVRMRSWFSTDLVTQGVVLYDNQTYKGICQEHPEYVA